MTEPPETTDMFGRSRELAALHRALAPAAQHLAIARLVGAPGAGKTTLLAALRQSTQFSRIITIALTEDEQGFAWAGLAVLLDDAGEAMVSLPDQHRHALLVATGAVAEGTVERSAVAFALAALLEVLSAIEPLLLIVDDFQWLDHSTAAALLLAMRRQRSTPLAVVVAHRDEVLPADIGRLAETLPMSEIEVGGLDSATVRTVLRQRFAVALPRVELEQFWSLTRGNPLHVCEVARLVAEHGRFDEHDAPTSAIAAISRRLDDLASGAKEVLAIAALAEPAALELVEQVLARRSRSDVAELEAAGLLRLTSGLLQFPHPLQRAAVVQLLGGIERMRLHALIAAHTSDHQRRAFHLAQSVDGEAPDVAEELDLAARLATERGDTDVATRLRRRAVQLTPADHPAMLRRLMDTAAVAAEINDPTTCATMARRALLLATSDDDIAASTVLLIVGLVHAGQASEALEELQSSLNRVGEPGLRVRLLEYQVRVSMFASLPQARDVAHRLAEEARELGGEAEALAWSVEQELQLMTGHPVDVPELLRRAEALDPIGHQRIASNLAEILCFLDLHAPAARLEQALYDDRVQRGDSLGAALAASRLSELALRCGRWAEAETLVLQCVETAQDGAGDSDCLDELADMARLCAMQGRFEEADAWVERCRRGLSRPVEIHRVTTTIAAGLVAHARRDYPSAVTPYRDAAERAERLGFTDLRALPFRVDLVECLIAVGDTESAGQLADELHQRSAHLTDPRPLADAAWARGLVSSAQGDLTKAAAYYATALEHWSHVDVPFSRARTLLAAGATDRRAGQRTVARARLEDALRVFTDLNAQPWIARAEDELDRLGARRAEGDELTPTEQQVAALVAKGHTNAEVAVVLFMSPKTVEHHLTRIFRKLNVRTRTQLSALLGARDI